MHIPQLTQSDIQPALISVSNIQYCHAIHPDQNSAANLTIIDLIQIFLHVESKISKSKENVLARSLFNKSNQAITLKCKDQKVHPPGIEPGTFCV